MKGSIHAQDGPGIVRCCWPADGGVVVFEGADVEALRELGDWLLVDS